MTVPVTIPFPATWYSLTIRAVAQPLTQTATEPIFNQAASQEPFLRVTDNESKELSWSSREAVELYLTNLGFVKVDNPKDPELWKSSPAARVINHWADLARVVEMRVYQ